MSLNRRVSSLPGGKEREKQTEEPGQESGNRIQTNISNYFYHHFPDNVIILI